jgi:DNA-binding NtrC family response regulator
VVSAVRFRPSPSLPRPWIASIAAKQVDNRSAAQPYHEAVNAYRRELIVKKLLEVDGNRAAAANSLGLHRTHLLKLMKALHIE